MFLPSIALADINLPNWFEQCISVAVEGQMQAGEDEYGASDGRLCVMTMMEICKYDQNPDACYVELTDVMEQMYLATRNDFPDITALPEASQMGPQAVLDRLDAPRSGLPYCRGSESACAFEDSGFRLIEILRTMIDAQKSINELAAE